MEWLTKQFLITRSRKKSGCDLRHTLISENWQRNGSDRSTTVVPTSEYGRITLWWPHWCLQVRTMQLPTSTVSDHWYPAWSRQASASRGHLETTPLVVRNTVLPQNVQYVLDGGALLHRIPWNSGKTYEGISSHYVRYVGDRYGNTVIVFDGYVRTPSTKDVAHSRRVQSHSSPLVNFTKDMVCTMKKDDFLANQTNKQRFINLLSDDLQRHNNTCNKGVLVHHY